jgi:hypothetical protein
VRSLVGMNAWVGGACFGVIFAVSVVLFVAMQMRFWGIHAN